MYSQAELRELDIESWKRKLEGGEPEESLGQILLHHDFGHFGRRVSTTLRQVPTEFSERFSFPQGNFAPGSPSNDDRQLGRPTAFPLFLFHPPLPTRCSSAVRPGLLITTSLARA